MRLFLALGHPRCAILFALTTALLVACGRPPAAAAEQTIVFSFGRDDDGRTGHGTASTPDPHLAKPIDHSNLSGKTIIHASAGGDHSLLVADDGTAFSFGNNFQGQIGLGEQFDNALIATPIDTSNLGGRSIVQASAGMSNHSLLLADDGTVFAMGANASGRTGQGTSTGLTWVAEPIQLALGESATFKQVSAGFSHSLLVSDDGVAYAFGTNSRGQTGLGSTSGNTQVATPIDQSLLDGNAVTQVAAGNFYSLILDEAGTVYSFGQNDFGTLGRGSEVGDTAVATPIDDANLGGRAITQIAAGNRHALLLADDGAVFAFGANGDGRTGLGVTEGITYIPEPIDDSNLAGRTIVQIAAGGAHSLLLADDGTVFSFGDNASGFTGQGTASGITPIAAEIDQTHLGGLPATFITAGINHSLLVAVPEPSTIVLALAAMASVMLFARRRRSSLPDWT